MKNKELEFGKYWVLSTAHLTLKDEKLLAYETPHHFMVIYPFEEGYWVHISSDLKDLIKKAKAFGFSKQFTKILNLAFDNKCQFIKFDRDGDFVTGLKKYTW